MSEPGGHEPRGNREYRVTGPLSDAERELVHSCDFQIGNVLTPVTGALSLWDEFTDAAFTQRPQAMQLSQHSQERLHRAVTRLEQALPHMAASPRAEIQDFGRLMASSLDFMKRLSRVTDLAVEFMQIHLSVRLEADSPALGRVTTYENELLAIRREFHHLMSQVDAHPVYQSYRAVTPENQRHHVVTAAPK